MNLKEEFIYKQHGNSEFIVSDPPFPKKLKIDICNSCNYNCIFCPTAIQYNKKNNIDDSLCKRIISDAYNGGAIELAFSSTGEPLLNPKLEEYILFSKNLCYEYVFVNKWLFI